MFGPPPENSICADHVLWGPLIRQLEDYWAGRLRSFSLPLDMMGSPFQKKVWDSLLLIPWGKTVTYSEQAKQIGDQRAVRAVAAANGRNPLAIVVPCHRVIGSDGSLTGYAGGLERKQALLEHEGWAQRGQLRMDL